MPSVTDSTSRWAVSTRLGGEVSTAEAASAGLHLVLLGAPGGYGPRETQGWLHDVIGVARETAAGDPTPRPIPTLLHHALTGLLFSHAELWDRPEAKLCSIAAVQSDEEAGIGWVGDALADVWIEDQPGDVRWVRVRDDVGREARAWCFSVGHRVRVQLRWRPGGAEQDAVIVAEWSPAPVAARAPRPLDETNLLPEADDAE